MHLTVDCRYLPLSHDHFHVVSLALHISHNDIIFQMTDHFTNCKGSVPARDFMVLMVFRLDGLGLRCSSPMEHFLGSFIPGRSLHELLGISSYLGLQFFDGQG